MNTKIILPIVITAVVVGGAAFFWGMKYQEMKTPSFGNRQFQRAMSGNQMFRNGQGGQGGMGMRFNGGAVMGEIISKDDKSITVKMDDGSSKIVLLSDSVTVSKNETGSKDELKTGAKVGVFGTPNQDGSVTAQNIQLNPMFRMFGGGMRPSPSASPK